MGGKYDEMDLSCIANSSIVDAFLFELSFFKDPLLARTPLFFVPKPGGFWNPPTHLLTGTDVCRGDSRHCCNKGICNKGEKRVMLLKRILGVEMSQMSHRPG